MSVPISDTRAAAIKRGWLYTASLAAPYLVFGTVCGVASKQAGADFLQAALIPALIFGGSSQIVLTSLLIAGAPLVVVIMSAIMVNSRMAVYSALLSPWLRNHTQRQRTLAAALVVDQTFAAAAGFREQTPKSEYWLDYYLSVGVTLWVWWIAANLIGYAAGAFVPASWELEFAVPLSFVAILAPIVKRIPMAVAALIGSILGVIFFALPFKLGLIVACVVGVCVMLLIESAMQWTP